MGNNGNSEPRKVNRHLDSLREKARGHTVVDLGNHTGIQQYGVVSGGSGEKYTVRIMKDNKGEDAMFCECAYAIKRGTDVNTGEVFPVVCSHTIAVFEFIARNGRRVSVLHREEEDLSKQKRPVANMGDGIKIVTRKGHYRQLGFSDLEEE